MFKFKWKILVFRLRGVIFFKFKSGLEVFLAAILVDPAKKIMGNGRETCWSLALPAGGLMAKVIAIGTGGMGLIPGPVKSDTVPPMARFFGAVLLRRLALEMGPATRYTFRRSATSIMKI